MKAKLSVSIGLMFFLVISARAQASTSQVASAAPLEGPSLKATPAQGTVGSDLMAMDAHRSARSIPEVCLVDDFGFAWSLYDDDGNVSISANWTETAGSVIDTGGGWNTTGLTFGTLDKATRSLTLEADNQDGVACILESDKFIYTGTRTGLLTYAGDWTSYCDGDVVGNGSWSGTFTFGSCGAAAGPRARGLNPTNARLRAGLSRRASGTEPITYALDEAFPNPFARSTTIAYALPKPGNVSVRVYNLLGKEVATLTDGFKPEGRYQVSFDGSRLSAGMYVYVLRAENYTETHQMLLMK